MNSPNTPLFVKTHDFIVWLINHTQKFPKNLRHSYTQRLEALGFEFEELVLMANAVRGRERELLLALAIRGFHRRRRCLQSAYERREIDAARVRHSLRAWGLLI